MLTSPVAANKPIEDIEATPMACGSRQWSRSSSPRRRKTHEDFCHRWVRLPRLAHDPDARYSRTSGVCTRTATSSTERVRTLGATPVTGDLERPGYLSLPEIEAVVHAAAYFRFCDPLFAGFCRRLGQRHLPSHERLIRCRRSAPGIVGACVNHRHGSHYTSAIRKVAHPPRASLARHAPSRAA